MAPDASLKMSIVTYSLTELLHCAPALGEDRVQGGNCSLGLGALLERKTLIHSCWASQEVGEQQLLPKRQQAGP